jgi:hypothetical protein
LGVGVVVEERDRRGVGAGVELCVELVDAVHVGRESPVVEGSVMGEREGGGAEIGEGKVELVPEPGLGVSGLRVSWTCSLAGGGLAAVAFELAVERVEVEDGCVPAGEAAEVAVELIERAGGLTL